MRKKERKLLMLALKSQKREKKEEHWIKAKG